MPKPANATNSRPRTDAGSGTRNERFRRGLKVGNGFLAPHAGQVGCVPGSAGNSAVQTRQMAVMMWATGAGGGGQCTANDRSRSRLEKGTSHLLKAAGREMMRG